MPRLTKKQYDEATSAKSMQARRAQLSGIKLIGPLDPLIKKLEAAAQKKSRRK